MMSIIKSGISYFVIGGASRTEKKGVQTTGKAHSIVAAPFFPMNMKSLLIRPPSSSCALPVWVRAEAPKGWTDNYAHGREPQGRKEILLLILSGSDWCGFCKLLEKEVFSTPQFANWAKKNVILVQVDGPPSDAPDDEVKKQNSGLAPKYPVNGYPTIVILKPKWQETPRRSATSRAAARPLISRAGPQMKKAGRCRPRPVERHERQPPGAVDLQDDPDSKRLEVKRRTADRDGRSDKVLPLS